MLGRSTSLISSPLLFSLPTLLFLAGGARAHRLDAQAFLLPGKQVQVESWFSDGTAARGARVQVYRPNGQLFTEGRMDEKGIFVFSFADAEALRIVVSAAGGHRKELRVAAEDPSKLVPTEGAESPGEARTAPSAVPLADRSTSLPLKDVMVGVGFLLALGAFVLSLRNARQLRALSRLNQQPVTQPVNKQAN